jgi:glutamate-1-semialdehyde 2,1-aminomutase
MAPYNDTDRALALIEGNAADLAAVIVEPMTGSGGCIPATHEFLSALRAATEKHGIVLIFDEVMTSRLSPGGYQKVVGITPDMMSLGKYVGGGLSFGAFGGRAELMARFDPATPGAFAHAGTFNNNVLSLSAGIAGLTEAYTETEATRLNADGETLRGRLNEVIAKHGVPAQVTGYGSMMMLHLTDRKLNGPVDTNQVPAAARALFHLEMMARAHYVARRNMIVLSLPMTPVEFDGLVAAFDDFLSTYRGVLSNAA